MKTRFRAAATAAAVTALLAVLGGCSSGGPAPSAPGSPGTSASAATIPQLTVGTNFSMSTLDPTKASYAGYVNQLSLETLLKFGPNTKLEPNLATSWQQTSPVTYAYQLRHGVTFWNGDPLTAADVAYTWNFDRAPGSLAALGFGSVKSVAAAGPYTVVVTLTHPDASWQYTPAGSATGVFEAKFAQAHKGTFGNPGVLTMGSGPWVVNSFDPTTGAQLTANPHWWGGPVPVRHITVRLFASETSLALAMRAGEIDLDPYILDTTTFAATSGVHLETAASCSLGVFSMNVNAGPWSDVHVRRAVAYALNRTDIIAAAGGHNTPISTFIPPQALESIASPAQVGQLLSSVNTYPYSLASARRELAQSAYPHGFSTTLYEYNYGSSVDISETIAAELAKIGITAHVKVAPTLTAWQATMTGPPGGRGTEFSTGWCAGPDVSAYDLALGSWNAKPGEWNTADYTPAAVDGLINAGLATSDPAKRFAIYSSLIKDLQSDLPYIGLYQESTSIALSGKFTVPGFAQNYWFFNSNAYALDVRPAS
jgi:peptide/nickel transport system substrate-binding protein